MRDGEPSLFYDRGVSGAYGWVDGLGHPPGRHRDIILLTCQSPRPGDRLLAHGGIISRLYQCFLNLPMQTDVGLVTGDTGIHLWWIEAAHHYVLFANRSDRLDEEESNRNW